MDKIIVKVVEKAWGREEWLCNNNLYCGKLLFINDNKKLSMHFHKDKTESWYVLSGSVIARYIDTTNANIIEFTLHAGDAVQVDPLLPHQIEGVSNAIVIECSTHHEDSDSYRVMPGNSQITNKL